MALEMPLDCLVGAEWVVERCGVRVSMLEFVLNLVVMMQDMWSMGKPWLMVMEVLVVVLA